MFARQGEQTDPEAQMGLRGRPPGLTVGRKACQASTSRWPSVTVGLVASRLQLIVEIPEGRTSLTFMPKSWKGTRFLRI